ncbi:MAG TPA: carboxypeptidase-like regulatory domain-containing protein, partial [Pyrinomonadaceae bacterium]|nr:carboxypeptidase-like regulatory domain-containing protein [Pyrinomonadaceae bacterium]
MFSFRNTLFLVTAFFCVVTLSFGQGTSTISGTVYDSTNAVVGGADVMLLNESTGVKLSQVTNEVGLYSFPAIAAGTYTVTIEIPGFKTSKRTGIILNVGIPSVQNFTLEIGGAAETVSVEATALAVNTTSATIGNVIERVTIQALPLNGRNPLNLIVL